MGMRHEVARGLVAWLAVAAVVCAPMAAAVVLVPVDGPEPATSEDPVSALKSRIGTAGVEVSKPVSEEVTVVVELEDDATLPTDRLSSLNVRRVYTRRGARHITGTLPMTEIRRLSHDPRVRAVHIERLDAIAESTPDRRVAPGVAAIGADALHAHGITGEDVIVGVIDRGFRPSDPSIANNVAAYRAFDDDTTWVHGTAVASIVADTAPDADLHLAAVGPSTTPKEYSRAVAWLKASGADVIVDSGSYFGANGEGSGDVADVAAAASDDVVFVTSAGNYANRHWAGVHRPNATTSSWVAFGDSEGNALAGNEPFAGHVSVAIQWNSSADYDLFLLRARPGDDSVVAMAERDGDAAERIDTRVPRGRYYVAVRADLSAGPTELELFANRDLANATANGSLTSPATAQGVVAVGAYGNGAVRDFSSRGPIGNRTGVGLVAPDSVAAVGLDEAAGTSYAAPYVAGTAALLTQRYPSLSPAELRAVLRDSARDVGPEGPDARSGGGLLDAKAAIDLAGERILLDAGDGAAD